MMVARRLPRENKNASVQNRVLRYQIPTITITRNVRSFLVDLPLRTSNHSFLRLRRTRISDMVPDPGFDGEGQGQGVAPILP